MTASIIKKIRLTGFAFLCLGAFLSYPFSAHAKMDDLTIFAAASTTSALNEIADLYKKNEHKKIAISYGSSSTLAKQIENGAPANIFISANTKWMDYLAEKEMLANDTRKDLLGNQIVLIVPEKSDVKEVTISPDLDIKALLGKDGRLSVGDPAHVPVGTYSKAAMEHLGLWDKIKDRIAPAKDVRAGMLLVEQNESPLGIVYASDALVSKKVRVIGVFPASSHPKVDYPAAVIKQYDTKDAREFLVFLQTEEAKKIWKKFGFEVR